MSLETLRRIREAQVRALDLIDTEILAAEKAQDASVAPTGGPEPEGVSTPASGLAWGAKVSPEFRDRVRWLAADLDIGPEPGKPEPGWVMTWMAWESGRSFRPDVKNMAGSGATGLIQFMPATAKTLGTSIEALERMTAEDQLNYVWKYFKPYKGRIRSLADGYMAILWPKAVGKPDDYVLWDRDSMPTTFRQNAGLDTDHDGRITKRETAAKVAALLPEGLKQGNVA